MLPLTSSWFGYSSTVTVDVSIASFKAIGELQRKILHQSHVSTFGWNGRTHGQQQQQTLVAARCVTEAFSTTCAVHIEDCEGWWLSDCRSSVAQHWRLKPEVSWVRLPVAAGLFTFLYFCPITAKLIY